jgi:hypothetical protein
VITAGFGKLVAINIPGENLETRWPIKKQGHKWPCLRKVYRA